MKTPIVIMLIGYCFCCILAGISVSVFFTIESNWNFNQINGWIYLVPTFTVVAFAGCALPLFLLRAVLHFENLERPLFFALIWAVSGSSVWFLFVFQTGQVIDLTDMFMAVTLPGGLIGLVYYRFEKRWIEA